LLNYQTMALPRITVAPGREASIFNKTDRISGFEGISANEVDGMCSMVKEEMKMLLGKAPKAIADALGPRIHIPLYNSSLMRPEYAKASCLFEHVGMATSKNSTKNNISFDGCRRPKFWGMGIPDKPHENIDEWKSTVGHEILHLLTSYALNPQLKSVSEVFVRRLQTEYYGERDDIAGKWKPHEFLYSTGLRPPDFATIDFTDALEGRLLMATFYDLNHIRAETLWSIIKILTQEYQRTEVMPRWQSMENAILAEAQELGAQALAKPSFQPMQPGRHFVALPNPVTSGSIIVSFEALRRGDWGLQQKGEKQWFQEKLFECRLVQPDPMEGKGFDRNGHLVNPTFNVSYPVPMFDVTFNSIIDMLKAAGLQGIEYARKIDGRIELVIPSTGTVVLQKTDDEKA
jgi:hypothetical protein